MSPRVGSRRPGPQAGAENFRRRDAYPLSPPPAIMPESDVTAYGAPACSRSSARIFRYTPLLQPKPITLAV